MSESVVRVRDPAGGRTHAPPGSAHIVAGGVRHGTIGTFVHIVRSEGTRSLWRGTLPTLYRTVPGVGIYFYSLDVTKRAIAASRAASGVSVPAAVEALAAGGLARVWVVGVTLPFTVLKTRFESGLYSYSGMVEAIRSVYRKEGLRGFYRGFTATALRDAPFSGIYYAFYEDLKARLQSHDRYSTLPSPTRHMIAGLVAGCLATLVTHPPDIVRTRMQLFPSTEYSGTFHTALRIAREEGARAFLRGLTARVMRRAIMSALTWTMYEEAIARFMRTWAVR